MRTAPAPAPATATGSALLAAAILFVAAPPTQARQTFDSGSLSEFNWRLLGPSMPAGRAWTVVGVESDPKTLFVTTAGGGLWRTKNHGTTFEPVFDDANVASTGAVAISKSNPNVVWLGTGEPANTRANSWGNGVYKSVDGGDTWAFMGLGETFLTGHITIHPTNPDIVYVAALGRLWGSNEERGVFKTTDGGNTWENVLYINDTTGAIDIVLNPTNPDELYAAMWQRFRFGGGDMDEAGPESGIYKTTDGGDNWTRLMNGLPTDDMGKIELAMGFENTQILYAAILTGEPGRGGRTSPQGGIFRTDNGGESWVRVNERMTSYYYDHIYVDPSDDNTVWMPVFELNRSTDGGRTFQEVNMRHVHNDLHSMWIDPSDRDHIAVTGDGGVSISFDRGNTWLATALPIGQFYEISVDNQQPYHVIGGMQDTGHWIGPSRTYDDEGITNSDWYKMRYVGDGMASATDPRDPNIIYLVQQFGNTSRMDLRDWTRTELQPRDADELNARGATHRMRWNWTPAFILSEHDPDYVYLGSNYLFRIHGETGEWDIISPDLTWQQDQTFHGIEDGYHSYGSLFSIAESHFDENTLWAGADDGPIWVTQNLGVDWTEVTANLPSGAPTNCVVAEIETSRFNEQTAYIALDCHTKDDTRPYIYATSNFGNTWASITANLPDGSAYVVREDPDNADVLYAGTESGVWLSIDRGTNWISFKSNMPPAGVRAMVIQPRDRDLIAGTFGRAIWAADIGPFAEFTSENFHQPLHLFKTEPAIKFRRRVTFGNSIEELNGDQFFRGENPPYGATITYYLRDALQAGVRIEIADAAGNTVRTLLGSGIPGIRRVQWDLRSDATADATPSRGEGLTMSESAFRQLVPLGTYTVTISGGRASASGTVEILPEPGSAGQVAPRR